MWLSILTLILRSIGLVQWAVALEKQIEANKKTQEIANAPLTNKEEESYWDSK